MSRSACEARAAHARRAYLWACGLDVAVRKPGNVSVGSAGHGMRTKQFIDSAEASAGPLLAIGAHVGERIEGAIAATRVVAGCNTNLGIVLLCAPLAQAWERSGEARLGAFRVALEQVLGELDLADAEATYRAIALANPGGLGRAEKQDVAHAPTVDLRSAMTLAADRDRIARQYRDSYRDVIDTGLAELAAPGPPGGRLADAVQRAFLSFLASAADSHIVRKLDSTVAHTVTHQASQWLSLLRVRAESGRTSAFASWDESLKRAGINPGTSADLTVASCFLAALIDPVLAVRSPGDSWHGICMNGAASGGH